ncbi:MAG: mechanosensitive ion channel domain-containing protein [Gallionella sp.]
MKISLEALVSHPLIIQAVQATLAMLVVFLLVHFARVAASGRIEDKNLRYTTRKAISLMGYLLALIIILVIFSEQMTNLTVIIGALSVGIGFALRELIQSVIGWTIISFSGLYKPGERIQIGDIMGDVIDINPVITTVMECGGWVKADLYNGRLVRLSNSLVFSKHIINYTADFPFLWDEIVIPVRTDSDYHLARGIILNAGQTEVAKITAESKQAWLNFMRRYRIEDANLDPAVTMSFDSNFIELTLRYVVDYRVRRSTKDRLFANILGGFEETQGKVQIGSTTLQLTQNPSLSTHHEMNNQHA